MFDAGLAAQTLCLAAWDMGIGSIILGAFDPAIAQVAELPEGERVAALIALGWPDETPAAPRRKEVADILRILWALRIYSIEVLFITCSNPIKNEGEDSICSNHWKASKSST